ncbi:MAG: TIR domain-containing protein [Bacillota bacterium]|nr:TIR domain-containing protein [Bacillota bacterium]
MGHDVFISYSSNDRNVANTICSVLESRKVRCWIASRDITPGREWGESIIEAIEQSKIMVLIFSSAANKSQQVLREVERAVNKNVIIIPFRIEDVLPTKSMEYFLYATHWLDALTPDMEMHVRKLVDTVDRLIKDPTAANESTAVRKAVNLPKGKNLAFLLGGMGISIILLLSIFFIFIKPSMKTADTNNTEKHNTMAGLQNIPKAMTENTNAVNSAGKTAVKVETGTSAGKTQKSADLGGKSQPDGINNSAKEMKVGEYILFGTYYDKPIQWRIININSNGCPLLLSEKILTLKAFDAAESGTYNHTPGGIAFDVHKDRQDVYKDYSQKDLRSMKGSNYWLNSNIREWLNSTGAAVKYTSQPPSAGTVSNENAYYDDEPGFLHFFSDSERSLIMPVTHKVLVSGTDRTLADGGSALYSFSRTSISKALFNYDNAYFKNVQDKVFLLSVEDVINYIQNRGWKIKTGLTPEAIEHDRSGWYRDLSGQTGGSFMWWLSTPYAGSGSDVCIVSDKGDIIYNDYATAAGVGVRPALYLNTSNISVSGSGSESDPYAVK